METLPILVSDAYSAEIWSSSDCVRMVASSIFGRLLWLLQHRIDDVREPDLVDSDIRW